MPLLLTLRLNLTIQIEIRTSEMKAKDIMKKNYKFGDFSLFYSFGLS